MVRCRNRFLPSIVHTLTWIISLSTVQGLDCYVPKEPFSFTGDIIQSVTLMWNCTLMSNESTPSVLWSKDDTCIAKVINGIFKPCENYIGRVEIFGTFGITLHNISRNDSGFYTIVTILHSTLREGLRCQSIYLLVLMQHETKNQPWEGGLNKLDIGLLCGLVTVTIIGFALGLSCFIRRRPDANETGNEGIYTEQMEMLQFPTGKE
ncbi:hypothetical protein CHS0354_001637 [Potamilus streckersoni]|uniref:Uncharacterized protein n=1 Tax=Potamilus streckersoni TaxID=2493646 RepID=A0AAE0VZR7_9BIVA|nr:hypothetical protein CHS0354_001637 [Potamilus streckersoni]